MADDDVHRLRDILVEEVSLVDRAANKRRFLLVKREGDMSELRSNGRGGFTTVRKGDDDPEDETEKAKKKPFPGAAKPFGGKPEPDADDEEEKRKRAEEEKRKAKAKPDPDPDYDEDEEKRRAAAKAGAKLSEQLGDVADELSKLADEMDDDEEPSDVNMKKLLAAHRKIAGMADAYLKHAAKKSIGVAKVGRKMSAARLAMYKEALATLQALLSELMDSPAKDKDHAPDPGDPQVAPPGFKAANPSGAPGNAQGVAAIKSLLKGMDDVFASMKTTIAQQGQQIAKLEKGVTPSNALQVDRGGAPVRKGADVVVWPMDLNARAGRDKVDKSVSFLEDD